MSIVESVRHNQSDAFSNEARLAISQAVDRVLHRERFWTVDVIDNKVGFSEVREFANWYRDGETAKHFAPPLRTRKDVERYYFERDSKLFLVARNFYHEPIGVVTLMGRNPFLRGYNKRTAYVEKLVVKPQYQGRHKGEGRDIGKTLMATVNDFVFQPKPGDEKPRFEENHLYIMTDEEAGRWWVNYHFFIDKLGYQIDQTKPQWIKYARETLHLLENREALLLVTNPVLWENEKKMNSSLKSAPLKLTGRVPAPFV